MIRQTAQDFATTRIKPHVMEWDEAQHFPVDWFREMGELGFMGVLVPETYGGAGLGYQEYITIIDEIAQVCGSIGLSVAAHNSLCTGHILQFGTEEQKQKYLPKLASGEYVGCFGLTEPDYGSDAGSLVTRAEKTDGGYKLTGSKMWISNAPIADIAVIWAKLDGVIRGFIVDRSIAGDGFDTPMIKGKLSLRASITGSIMMDGAFVPEENIFPEVQGLKGPFSCLNKARYGISWGTLGAAEFCWHAARQYTLDRKQFGRPLAANQLVQLKLANMMTEITLGLQSVLRVGRMLDEGTAAPDVISIVKRNSCGKALEIARTARDMHGGNGISEEYHVMRHAANLETVNTYEGTHDIHALILGRAQTGIQAFTGA